MGQKEPLGYQFKVDNLQTLQNYFLNMHSADAELLLNQAKRASEEADAARKGCCTLVPPSTP